MPTWSPSSWKQFPSSQLVDYQNNIKLESVLHELTQQEPLVDPNEIEHFQNVLIAAESGHAFILQAGDCAEPIQDYSTCYTQNQIKLILKLADIISQGIQVPVIPVGRIAGQYCKPRTQLQESIGNTTLPSYRGDLINRLQFDAQNRIPNPDFLHQGYITAKQALKDIQKIVLPNKFFYTSHEALHLPFEQALTRIHNGKWYNCSTHFPWIGMRTTTLNSPHVEFCRGIENPIGLKIGAQLAPGELCELVRFINPQNLPGKIVLITRLGLKNVKSRLPELIKAIQKFNYRVSWMCDPMHGNSYKTSNGFKTRAFNNICDELEQTIAIHNQYQSTLSGAHLELTANQVTECIGGTQAISEADLGLAYQTSVDPRLNPSQALELVNYLTNQLQNYSLPRVC